jgi:hypothetical integral membrane protein (TIGR02206 family)
MKQFFGTEHIVTLGVIVATISGLVVAARMRPGPWTLMAARILAVVLLVNELSWLGSVIAAGQWNAQWALPLNLCDSTSFVAAAALWTRRPLLVELTWFWGIAGTAQGLLTPETGTWHFPQYNYIQYFVAHGGIVISAFFLVVGLGIRPRKGAIARVVALTLAYAAVIGAIDVIVQGNYMYLRHKPGVASMLDVFGPWPYYIVGATGLAVVFFTLLDLPFWRGRSRDRSAAESTPIAISATRAGSIPPG